MTTLIDSVNELILSPACVPNHRTTRQISWETGIHYCSVYRIVHQNLNKLKCLIKRCVQERTVANCALWRTRARKLLHRFPASAVDLIVFTDEKIFTVVLPVNLQNDRFYVPTMSRESLIELLTLASDFAALCVCQQWLYMTCILLGLQINTMHQYKVWNACLVANFLCYNIAKYFLDRSTTQSNRKKRRVPVIFETRCILPVDWSPCSLGCATLDSSWSLNMTATVVFKSEIKLMLLSMPALKLIQSGNC